jgi:hypothetical protein
VLSVQNVAAAIITAGGRELELGVHYTVEGSTFELLAEGFALFDSLAEGAEDTFVVTFEVTDGIAAVANTLTVTVEGANDAPVVAALVRSVGEDGPEFSIDLLTEASDPDEGDVLSVQNVDAAIITAAVASWSSVSTTRSRARPSNCCLRALRCSTAWRRGPRIRSWSPSRSPTASLRWPTR